MQTYNIPRRSGKILSIVRQMAECQGGICLMKNQIPRYSQIANELGLSFTIEFNEKAPEFCIMSFNEK